MRTHYSRGAERPEPGQRVDRSKGEGEVRDIFPSGHDGCEMHETRRENQEHGWISARASNLSGEFGADAMEGTETCLLGLPCQTQSNERLLSFWVLLGVCLYVLKPCVVCGS